MADKKRALDVWIVETNTVYREVPFTVITDWIQQGRLLPEDKARPAGKGGWYRLADIPAFAPYFPKPEAHRVEDQAEALEPIEVEVPTRRRRHSAEEDDPDMIPLIDITLVLLIFFMMTAAVQAGLFSGIDTPEAKYQLVEITGETYWVGIEPDARGAPRYSLGLDQTRVRPPDGAKETSEPGIEGVLLTLRERLKGVRGEVRLSIRADRKLSNNTVTEVWRELERVVGEINVERQQAGRPAGDRLTLRLLGEVSDPQRGP